MQSSFLDELDVSLLAKTPKNSEDKVTLTLGKDIFLSKHVEKIYAYPEDFGLSRWQEVKEEKKKVIPPTPIELFVKELLSNTTNYSDYAKITSNWSKIKKELFIKLKIKPITNEIILEELENQKKSNEFSFERIFFIIEAIKRA